MFGRGKFTNFFPKSKTYPRFSHSLRSYLPDIQTFLRMPVDPASALRKFRRRQIPNRTWKHKSPRPIEFFFDRRDRRMNAENGCLEVVDDASFPLPERQPEQIAEPAFGPCGRDACVGFGRTDRFVRFDDDQPVSDRRTRYGSEDFSPAGNERRPAVDKERNVASHLRRQTDHLFGRQRNAEQFGQPFDRKSGVGRTSAETRSHRDRLV